MDNSRAKHYRYWIHWNRISNE